MSSLIKIGKEQVNISKEIYKEYYKMKRRERYLEQDIKVGREAVDFETETVNVVPNYEEPEDKIDKKKKEKVLELLLSQPIKGELYIDSDTKYWWKVVLIWINENQSDNTLVVSMQKIIDYMKSSGVAFNQNDQLVMYPINNFLNFYVKTLKGELKKKIELIFQE